MAVAKNFIPNSYLAGLEQYLIVEQPATPFEGLDVLMPIRPPTATSAPFQHQILQLYNTHWTFSE